MSAPALLRALPIAVLAALLPLIGACGIESLDPAACPSTGTPLTYESFGAGFFASYCDYCHSAPVGEREGAPEGYAFDTHEGILAHKERIFERSAGSNVSMPPGPDDPPLAEREKLAEWLNCGAP